MTRDELIAALEKAAGQSRELDAEIAFQIGAFDRYLMGMNDCHIVSVTPASNNCAEILIRADARTTGGVQYTSDLPAYTASIDAALTLVPEEYRVAVMEWDHEMLRAEGPWQCLLTPVGGGDSILADGQGRCDHAATPALARGNPALKARAAQ